MDQGGCPAIAQPGLGLVTATPGDSAGIGGIIGRHAAGDHLPVGTEDADGFAALELPLDLGHAHRQQ